MPRGDNNSRQPGPETAEKAELLSKTANPTKIKSDQASTAAVVQLNPLGMSPEVEIVGLEPQEGRVHYFLGNDPEKWRTHIPTYKAVLYRQAYPGVDLKFYGSGRQLEYDIIVKPGADPAQVKFQYQGIQSLEVTPQGELVIKLPGGQELIQRQPVIYQEVAGRRRPREGKFQLAPESPGVYSFTLAAYDRRQPLVIDPVLVFSTYLGGESSDEGYGIALDPQGNIYLTGETYSPNFPLLNPLKASNPSGCDAFVTKLNARGALVYSTYLGGTDGDYGEGIAADQAGNAYVTGWTNSSDFPHNPLVPYHGNEDAFVTRLNADGTLSFSTFLGGSSDERGYGVAADSTGNAYVAGRTVSTDFPVTPSALQPAKAAGATPDAFVTKFSASETLVYSTYLGGSGSDTGYGIAVNPAGQAYVTGYTYSSDFPHYPMQTHHGSSDVFVTKISADGSAAIFSIFLGGDNSDRGRGIAVDPAGQAHVTGDTLSSDFPVWNALQSSRGGLDDAFVVKLNAAGAALLYSTFLGGSHQDWGKAIALDPLGNAYVTGYTSSSDFPTRASIQSHCPGNDDAFVTKLTAGGALVYSTYLGGSDFDGGYGIAADRAGNAYVTGYTYADFPTRNPLQPSSGGSDDAFVAKLTEPGMPFLLLLLGD